MFNKLLIKEDRNFWDIPKIFLIIINLYWGFINHTLLAGILFSGVIIVSMVSDYKINFSLRWKKYVFYIILIVSAVIFVLFFFNKQESNLLVYYGTKLPYFAFVLLIEDLFGQKKNEFNFINKKKLYKKKKYKETPVYTKARLENLAFAWPKKYTAVIGFYPRAMYMIFMFIAILAVLQRDSLNGLTPFVCAAVFIIFVLNNIYDFRNNTLFEWIGCFILLIALSIGANYLVKFAQYKSQELYAEKFAREYSNSGWFNAFQQNTQIGQSGSLSDSQDLLLRVEWDKPIGTLLPASYFNITTNGVHWKSSIFGNQFIRDDAGTRDLPDANKIPSTEIMTNAAKMEDTVLIKSSVNLEAVPQKNFKDEKSAILIGTPLKYNRGETALPLPQGTHVMLGTEKARISAFANGGIMYSGYNGEVNIQALYSENPYIQLHAPMKTDLSVPSFLLPVFEKVIKEANISSTDTVDEKIKKISYWYTKNFTYTIQFDVNGRPKTIEDFLLKDRKGHCEYFASTSSMLLRYMGIPSRYAIGFLVQERHPEEEPGMYWVRQRDAHAWSVYWDGKGWKSLDTTPSMSEDMEAGSSMFSILSDKIESLKYKMSNLDTSSLFTSTYVKAGLTLLIVIVIITGLLTRKRWKKVVVIDTSVVRNVNYPELELNFKAEMAPFLEIYPKYENEPWGIWAKNTKSKEIMEKVKDFYKIRY